MRTAWVLDGFLSILITTVRDRQPGHLERKLGNYEGQRLVSLCLEQGKLR